MKRIKTGISYFGVRNPRYVKLDMEEIKSSGLDFVIHTFSENDLLYYLDTMKEIVEITKDSGLEVYMDPWGVGRVFGGEAFSRFALLHPETRQRISDGSEAPASCPNHPQFREFMKEWIDSVAYLGADGVFFDEPHFFNVWELPGRTGYTCTCNRCRFLFRQKYGYPMPEEENEDVRIFKRESIKTFIGELAEYAKKKSLKTMLCLLPRHRGDIDYWESFFELKFLDNIGTDPYWRHIKDEEFETYVRDFVKLVGTLGKKRGKETHIWVQGFSVKGGEEWKIEKVIDIAEEEGIHSIAIWSFRGTEYMSYIKPDNPRKVWETYLKRIANLKEK